MSKSWASGSHSISDIRDWQSTGRLEIQPDFQRKEVWSEAARIMLMDTILRGIPMPKIFVSSEILDDKTRRTVIDGQQRISAILAFLNDKFVLAPPYSGVLAGKRFSEIPVEQRNNFLQYRIDFNEAMEFSEDELRETYSRLNKYSVQLTKQELRRADFPGDFLQVSESLASNEFLEAGKVFSLANRRRLSDVEFMSELLAALISGPQDKRDTLDDFYLKYSTWEESEKSALVGRFNAVLSDLQILFPAEKPISATRFKQKSDLYSLVLAIDDLRTHGGTLEGVDPECLWMDLRMLDYLIAPESPSQDCRDYAIKCVSQANTLGSRRWRAEFLKALLAGTYLRALPIGDAATLFYRLATGNHGPYGNSVVDMCAECGTETVMQDDVALGWRKSEKVFQVHNSCKLHAACANASKWNLVEADKGTASLSFSKTEHQTTLI